MQRNLMYTGVTRGRRLVVLIGQRKALAIAVKRRAVTTTMVKAAGMALLEAPS
jgi:exodeoxyribonuclease V alpha subunit